MTVTEHPESMTISEAAAAAGLTPDTLRYYEKAGLILHRPERSASGQRRYTPDDLRWLGTLVMLRGTGMPIRDMTRFVELYREPGSEPERLRILQHHRERVLEELAEVQTHLAAIDRKIEFYEEKVSS